MTFLSGFLLGLTLGGVVVSVLGVAFHLLSDFPEL